MNHKTSKITTYALFVGVLALCLSATAAKADDWVMTFAQAYQGGTVTITKPKTATDRYQVTLNFPAGSPVGTKLIYSGSYFTYTDDGTTMTVVKTGGGNNGGGGDKNPHGPTGDLPLQVQPIGVIPNKAGTGVDLDWSLYIPTDNVAFGVPGSWYLDQDGFHGWRPNLFYVDSEGTETVFMPDGGPAPGLRVNWTNNQTGTFTTYVIPNSFITGTIGFVGNDTTGYLPTSLEGIKIGSFNLMGTKKAPINPNVFKNIP